MPLGPGTGEFEFRVNSICSSQPNGMTTHMGMLSRKSSYSYCVVAAFCPLSWQSDVQYCVVASSFSTAASGE